ncbi:hypothetical protein M0R45_007525 [Rubus argutus]|uniref:Uncharacterized protein n=1 Tax=Rubus argutus TaxID=59490 RepID=A0AAW1XYH9_RUBAR
MAQKWLHLLLLLLLISGAALSQNFTNTLPGYPGELPFSLETGYVGVGDMEEALVACSAFSGLVYDIGPLTFDYAAFNGSVPTFLDIPYSWTQIDNVIFVDAHVGAGFTYSTTQEDFYTDDYKYAEIAYHFLIKYLKMVVGFEQDVKGLEGVCEKVEVEKWVKGLIRTAEEGNRERARCRELENRTKKGTFENMLVHVSF